MEIADFIRPLKTTKGKDSTESSVIVILSPVKPSREQFENIRKFQDVYFVHATSLGGKDFIRAHMINARAIVILANPLGSKFVHADEYMCDADAIRILRYVAGVCRCVWRVESSEERRRRGGEKRREEERRGREERRKKRMGQERKG